MRVIAFAALLWSGAALSQPAVGELKLWRLECGTFAADDFSDFSDTGSFDGQSRVLTDSCYLIKHGDDYLLWDTGLPAALKGRPYREGTTTISVNRTIVEQLAQLGLPPEQITRVGISHVHDDHTGQLTSFPKAKLLIGRGDLDYMRNKAKPGGRPDRNALKPWLDGGAQSEAIDGDKDVFGDGTVIMLAMPGHTPGHHALAVKLRKSGTILLSGDQFHSAPSFAGNEVPKFNDDRAQTLASHDRFRRLARNWRAKIIIQHEAADVSKLPAFPNWAD